jgi:hypothetical protein
MRHGMPSQPLSLLIFVDLVRCGSSLLVLPFLFLPFDCRRLLQRVNQQKVGLDFLVLCSSLLGSRRVCRVDREDP